MMEPAVGPFIEVMRGIEPEAAADRPMFPTSPANGSRTSRRPIPSIGARICGRRCCSTKDCPASINRCHRFSSKSVQAAAWALWRERSAATSNDPVVSGAFASARGAGEVRAFLRAGAELWVLGAPIDWSQRYEEERRLKRPLPTYPFERKRYWVLDEERPAEPQTKAAKIADRGAAVAQQPARTGPSYTVETATWKRVQYSAQADAADQTKLVWLAFIASEDLDERFAEALRTRGDSVTVIKKGPVFTELGEGWFSCDPNQEADVDQLCSMVIKGLTAEQRLRVVYFCNPSRPRAAGKVASEYKREVDDKINAPIALIRSLTRHTTAKKISLTIVTRDGYEVVGTETIDPMMALPIGPCLASMHEYAGLNSRIVDVSSATADAKALAQQLAADLAEPRQSTVTAYRGNARWSRTVEPDTAFPDAEPARGAAQERRLSDNWRAGSSRARAIASIWRRITRRI